MCSHRVVLQLYVGWRMRIKDMKEVKLCACCYNTRHAHCCHVCSCCESPNDMKALGNLKRNDGDSQNGVFELTGRLSFAGCGLSNCAGLRQRRVPAGAAGSVTGSAEECRTHLYHRHRRQQRSGSVLRLGPLHPPLSLPPPSSISVHTPLVCPDFSS